MIDFIWSYDISILVQDFLLEMCWNQKWEKYGSLIDPRFRFQPFDFEAFTAADETEYLNPATLVS